MNLKLALPGGRTLKVKAEFPYKGSPIGYRALLGGKTAIVVGFSEDGQEVSLEFPDKAPITTEKHLKALLGTASFYALDPWLLLYRLLPSVFNWREEEYIVPSEKPQVFLDKKSLEILGWVRQKRKVKEESLKKRFGDGPVKYLLDLGFLLKKRQWKIPNIVDKVYRLSISLEEALQRVSWLKKKEEALRLIDFLFERRYATLEELKEVGFKLESVRNLIKRGIVVETEEVIPQINAKPTLLRQEDNAFLRPLGGKSLLMGSWQGVSTRIFREIQALVERGESALLFCDSKELLRAFYHQLYPFLREKLVLLSYTLKEKEFLKNWFRCGEEAGLVVLGSRISLLAPIKNLRLIVLLGDSPSKLPDGTDLRHFLFELSQYYGANFCVASPLPPLNLCLRDSWSKEVFIPSADVIVVSRKPEEVLASETLKILRECLDEENLILVNKVGYAYAYCRACGYLVECPRCASLLTMAKERSTLFCNSCGYKTVAKCPECGRELSELAFGIEKATEEVKKLLGSFSNLHFDTQPQLDRTYENVFVLHADNILSVPWYDSTERYFSYMWKALSISRKRLVVQTVLGHNPLLDLLKVKDWKGFCKGELERRREENLPPYSRLIRLEVKKEPDLSHLPVEISRRNLGNTRELLLKVNTKSFSSVLKFLRSLRPIRLEVL